MQDISLHMNIHEALDEIIKIVKNNETNAIALKNKILPSLKQYWTKLIGIFTLFDEMMDTQFPMNSPNNSVNPEHNTVLKHLKTLITSIETNTISENGISQALFNIQDKMITLCLMFEGCE